MARAGLLLFLLALSASGSSAHRFLLQGDRSSQFGILQLSKQAPGFRIACTTTCRGSLFIHDQHFLAVLGQQRGHLSGLSICA